MTRPRRDISMSQGILIISESIGNFLKIKFYPVLNIFENLTQMADRGYSPNQRNMALNKFVHMVQVCFAPLSLTQLLIQVMIYRDQYNYVPFEVHWIYYIPHCFSLFTNGKHGILINLPSLLQ